MFIRLYGRALCMLGIVLATLITFGSSIVIPKMTSERWQPLAKTLRDLSNASTILLLGYGLWIVLYLFALLIHHAKRPAAAVGQWYAIRIPKPSDAEPHTVATAQKGQRDAEYAREVVRALQSILDQAKADRRVALELWRSDGIVTWSMWLSHDDLFHHAYSMWQGIAPGCDVMQLSDPMGRGTVGTVTQWSEHGLSTDPAYPLRGFAELTGDPLDALISGLTPQNGIQQIGISLTLSRPPRDWKRRVRGVADALTISARELNDSGIKATATAMLEKAQQPCVTVALRCVVIGLDAATTEKQHTVLTAKLGSYTAHHGDKEQAWIVKRAGTVVADVALPASVRERWTIPILAIPVPPPLPRPSAPILSLDELACLWHLPTGRHINIARWRNNRYIPPAPALIVSDFNDQPPPFDETTLLRDRIVRITGGRADDGRQVYLGYPLKSYTFHQQITASTGAGKSHAAKVQLGELLRIGAGFCVIDHKGDLIVDLLEMIPDDRMDDVIVFDPLDPDHVLGLNLLDPSYLNKDTEPDFMVELLEALIASTDSHWGDSAGMQEALRYGAMTLMEGEPTPTIAHLYMLFSSSVYRDEVLSRVNDDDLVLFWTYQFPKLSEMQKTSMTALQRRLSQFLINRTVRTICNQAKTSVNFRSLMDNRKIFLAKLPMELIGTQAGAILSNVLINLILAAAFSRLDLAEDEREPWIVFVDEFQEAMRRGDPANYQKILERLRSFAIGLVLMHQGTSQLPAEMLATTLEIVQTRFVLSAFGPDAAVWSRQYPDARLSLHDWSGIPLRDEGYAAISVSGFRQPVCTVYPLPLWSQPPSTITPTAGAWQVNPVPTNETDAELDARLAELQQYDRKSRVRLLRDAPEYVWNAMRERIAVQRAAYHAVLLEHPGRIANRTERIMALSNLKVARPRDLALAELNRLTLSFPRDTMDDEKPAKKGKGKGSKEWGNDNQAFQANGSSGGTNGTEVNPRKMGAAVVVGAAPAAPSIVVPPGSDVLDEVYADIV